MVRLVVIVLVVACGSTEHSTTAPTTATMPAVPSDQPLPAVTKIGDACRLSKDCNPLGPHHRCMRTASGSHCYPSPMKVCDAPECGCFNNDPCVANELGTCSGYEQGVVICSN